MEFLELYLKSETHKVLSTDKQENMLNHAYIINSKDDMILNEFCMFAIKEIMCLSSDSPCNKCVNCLKIEHGNMVDLEIYPKEEKGLVVEDIENVVSSAFVKPMESKVKIFLLKNFDECTVQGQNKLLKTIEEPPQNVIFILAVKNISGVLQTILSRSKKIIEKMLDSSDIQKFLEDKKIENANLISKMCDGNLSIALKISENKDAIQIINLCREMLLNLKTSKDVLKYSSKILALKKDIPFFLDTLQSMLRDIVIFEKSNNLYFLNLIDDYKVLSKIYTSEMIEKIVKVINDYYKKMEFNCNVTGVIDNLLLKILEVKFLCR